MEIKTSELIGAALDWAVAKAEGYQAVYTNRSISPVFRPGESVVDLATLRYSTDWAQGGPIVEREIQERRMLMSKRGDTCEAVYPEGPIWGTYYGPTPLIAAMRCYVASELGDVVEIPEELT